MTNNEKALDIQLYFKRNMKDMGINPEKNELYYAAMQMAEWKDNQLSQSIRTILDTETEMLKDISENKIAKPATRKEYINILTERVKEVMNGN